MNGPLPVRCDHLSVSSLHCTQLYLIMHYGLAPLLYPVPEIQPKSLETDKIFVLISLLALLIVK